ncbi:MAG: DUF84 family protein, partial [Pseudonocardiaceae bacterium]
MVEFDPRPDGISLPRTVDAGRRCSLADPGRPMTMLAMVGSVNPVKIEAARLVIADMFGDAGFVESVAVPSGVPDQPMGSDVILSGALNRAYAARSAGDGDMGIGLEGGIIEVLGGWYCIGWSVVVTRTGDYWASPSNGVRVPDPVMDLVIDSGLELGDAEDKFFGRVNSKQAGGLI